MKVYRVMQLCLLVVLCHVTPSCAYMAKVTAQVTDETNQAVQGATVTLSYDTSSWRSSGADVEYSSLTDSSGTAIIECVCNSAVVDITAEKDGYYVTDGPQVRFTTASLNMLQPWNPNILLVLKPIVSPIPMYARQLTIAFPANASTAGLDLMLADWAAPFGKGTTGDFIIKWEGGAEMTTVSSVFGTPRYHLSVNSTMTLSFSNEGDGIQEIFAIPHYGSRLILPRNAPLDNYTSCVVKRDYATADMDYEGSSRPDRNYIFRVRTIKDFQGNIASCHYGKIHDDIRVDGRDKLLILRYYLNPTPNSRNLEFAVGSTLFTNLPSVDELIDP